MPEILDRCVRDVMDKGVPEDSAWPICRSALGLVKNASNLEEVVSKAMEIKDKKDFKNIRELKKEELFEVNNVEVFATGVWNGDKFTERDLEDMVQAFNEVGHLTKPFLKIGHSEGQKMLARDEMPAAGFVSNLRRLGNTLVADFVDVPKKVAQAIRNGAFSRVSSEIFFNIKVLDKKFRRMLKAVSILGGEMPAVVTLNDILALNAANGAAKTYADSAESTQAYDYRMEDEQMEEIEKLKQELAESKRRIDEQDAQLEQYRADEDDDKDEMPKLKKRLKQLEAENADLKKKLANITRKNEELTSEVTSYTQKIMHQEINTKIDKMIADGKLMPAKREVVFSFMTQGYEKKYTVEGKELSMDEIVEKLFTKDPELTKETETEAGKRQDMDEDKEIQKYAEDHGITYKEAYIELSSQKQNKE